MERSGSRTEVRELVVDRAAGVAALYYDVSLILGIEQTYCPTSNCCGFCPSLIRIKAVVFTLDEPPGRSLGAGRYKETSFSTPVGKSTSADHLVAFFHCDCDMRMIRWGALLGEHSRLLGVARWPLPANHRLASGRHEGCGATQ